MSLETEVEIMRRALRAEDRLKEALKVLAKYRADHDGEVRYRRSDGCWCDICTEARDVLNEVEP